MNDEVKVSPTPTRDEIRAALLGPKLAKSVDITIFDIPIELRQPSFASIMRARDESDTPKRAADMIVNYAYVPGTDEKVFTEEDIDKILEWPFGDDLTRLNTAIAELTGIDVSGEEELLKEDPLA